MTSGLSGSATALSMELWLCLLPIGVADPKDKMVTGSLKICSKLCKIILLFSNILRRSRSTPSFKIGFWLVFEEEAASFLMNSLPKLWQDYYRFYVLSWFCIALMMSCVLTPSGQAQPELAHSANSLIDSIGIFVHLNRLNAAYRDYSEIVKPRLQELGIRHIRDGVSLQDINTQHKFNDLAAIGVKSTLVLSAGGREPSNELDDKWIPSARIMCRDQPIIATETGYHNATGQSYSRVSEQEQYTNPKQIECRTIRWWLN